MVENVVDSCVLSRTYHKVYMCFYVQAFIKILLLKNSELIHQTPHRVDSHHVAHSHLPEVPIFSRPQVHLPASVVGLLTHQPVAVHHVAGLAVGLAVTIYHC